MKDMKTKGAVAGIIAAVLYGGAEMFDHEARIVALEEAVNPQEELEEEEAADEAPPALGKPGMAAPPIEAPESVEDVESNPEE
jgi:hypothetical protein